MRAHHRTRYGPSAALAVVVVLVALYLAPTHWLLEHRKGVVGDDFENRARALARTYDEAVRVIELPPAPAPAAITPSEPIIEIAGDESPVAEIDDAPSGEATETWTYDPLTAHAFGRRALLAPDVPDLPRPDTLNLSTVGSSAKAFAWADTSQVARAQVNFASVSASLFRRDLSTYLAQMQSDRMNEYWERYIMSDGSQ